MKTLGGVLFVLLLSGTTAFAQLTKPELLTSLERAGELVIGVADAMPTNKYEFRASKEVCTFGEQVKHAAGVFDNSMSWVRGTSSPKEGNDVFMALKNKDEIMVALHKTVEENIAALKRTLTARLSGRSKTEFFGTASRAVVAQMVIGHTNRHYGEMVIYLRLNGVVPPISRDQ